MNTQSMTESRPRAVQSETKDEGRKTALPLDALKRYLFNTGWLFAGKLFRMAFSMLVGIWVARYLGVTYYGMLSYGIAFAMLFRPVALFQLEGICVREIVKSPKEMPSILGSAFALSLISGMLSLALVITLIMMLRPDEPMYLAIVSIVGSGLVFLSFEVFDYWFRAHVNSKPVVISRTLVISLSASAKVAGILAQAPLLFFAWINLGEVILMALALVLVFKRSGQHVGRLRIRLTWIKRLFKDAWPLALAGVAATIYLRIDTIMIGEMLGPHDVGIYSAAVKLCEAWYFLPISIMSSLYPAVVRAIEKNGADTNKKMQQIYNLMVIMGYVAAVTTTLLAENLVTFLFGREYQQAADILIVNTWSAMFINIAMAKAAWLKAMNFTKIHFASTLAGAFVNVILNIVLIQHYGVIGAAWATVLSYSIESYLILFVFKRTRRQAVMITRALVFPAFRIKQIR